ncbi:uncharacterized protein LOC144347329 [Saccoglossus kowalevskii]
MAIRRLMGRIDQTLHLRNILLFVGWVGALYMYHLWLVGRWTQPLFLRSTSENADINGMLVDDTSNMMQRVDVNTYDESERHDLQMNIYKPTVQIPPETMRTVGFADSAETAGEVFAGGNAEEQIEDVANLIRTIEFGKELDWFEGTLEPRDHAIVPNIAHFVWYSCHDFHFYNLISMLSTYRIMKADRILFHTDCEPTGQWWEEAKMIPVLEVVEREAPTSVFGQPLNPYWKTHPADITRIEVLLQYGGIYFDPDVFVVNSLEPLRHYDFVMGRPREGRLNNGIIISTKESEFLKLYYENYKNYNSTCYLCNSITYPNKIAFLHRDLIHIELYTLVCSVKELWRTQIYDNFDWKNTRYSLHFFVKSVVEPLNPISIKTLNNTAGEVARYIYYGTRVFIPENAVAPRWWRDQQSNTGDFVKKVEGPVDDFSGLNLDSSMGKYDSAGNLIQDDNSMSPNDNSQPVQYIMKETVSPRGLLKQHKTLVVENIVHYIWFSCHDFRFEHLLSLVSAFRIGRAKRILFHTDCKPSGQYWQEAQRIPVLEIVKMSSPTTVFGITLNPSWKIHRVDVAKLMVLTETGGIYLDPDVFIVNDIMSLRHYDFVMGVNRDNRMSTSVIFAVKDSEFLQLMYESYKNYNQDCYFCNNVLYPTNLVRDRKELIHVEHFTPDNLGQSTIRKSEMYDTDDWKNRRYALHFPSKKIPDVFDRESIREMPGILGEVARFVYYGTSKPIKGDLKLVDWWELEKNLINKALRRDH